MRLEDTVSVLMGAARPCRCSMRRIAAIAVSSLALVLAGCSRHEDAMTADAVPGKSGAASSSSAAGKIPLDGSAAVERLEPRPETPLFNAIRKRDMNAVRSLVEKGADVNAQNVVGRTPLHTAAFYDRGPIAELLIAGGASVDVKDVDGLTPLHAAVLADNRAMATLLIAKGAEINAQTSMGLTPVHLASATGETEMLLLLMTRGARLDVQDIDGGSPLFYASRNGHPKTAALLEAKEGKR